MINYTTFANGGPSNTPPFPPPALTDSGIGPRTPPLAHFSGFGTNRDVPGNDPINSEHMAPIPNRKRRDSVEESVKAASTNNGGAANAMSDGGDGKRVKTRGNNRNESGKGETEASSGKHAEQQQTTPKHRKQDYIHVRARRGQATDSHSLAERARREKISERMKILQDLVPGCNEVIGKALVLDEIINYIQSLQSQIEFLSMKLEAVNRLTHCMENFPPKDIFGTAGMPFTSQASREYSRGSSPEWLHMQVGGRFERTT